MGKVIGMTRQELDALPVSVDLVTAARAFGIGRSGAYDMHARGEFPCRVVRAGRRIVVPRAELFRVLGIEAPSVVGGEVA